MIVAAVIEKATGMKLDAFAAKVLFEPLGVEGYRWEKDSTGLCHAGGGLFLRPYDMVKIGLTVMNGGTWNGRRIVSEAWIRKLLSPYFATSLDNSRYGYFWWIRDMDLPTGRTARVVSAEGGRAEALHASRIPIARGVHRTELLGAASRAHLPQGVGPASAPMRGLRPRRVAKAGGARQRATARAPPVSKKVRERGIRGQSIGGEP